MERQVLLDKLSEFLMVEQGGLELYRVAAERCTTPALKQRFEEFGHETARHREVLVGLIGALGGDPSYVSPGARLAQVKAKSLLEASLVVDGLSQPEIEANDVENVVLAETKDHANWQLLTRLGQQITDPEMVKVFQEVVEPVENEEDEHLAWARETLGQLALTMVMEGPAPPPDRMFRLTTGPVPPLSEIHPAPVEDGLLAPAKEPAWAETPVVRAVVLATGSGAQSTAAGGRSRAQRTQTALTTQRSARTSATRGRTGGK